MLTIILLNKKPIDLKIFALKSFRKPSLCNKTIQNIQIVIFLKRPNRARMVLRLTKNEFYPTVIRYVEKIVYLDYELRKKKITNLDRDLLFTNYYFNLTFSCVIKCGFDPHALKGLAN